MHRLTGTITSSQKLQASAHRMVRPWQNSVWATLGTWEKRKYSHTWRALARIYICRSSLILLHFATFCCFFYFIFALYIIIAYCTFYCTTSSYFVQVHLLGRKLQFLLQYKQLIIIYQFQVLIFCKIIDLTLILSVNLVDICIYLVLLLFEHFFQHRFHISNHGWDNQ